MSLDARKNFAYSTIAVAPSPDTSGTSLEVQAADGAKFAAVSFNAVVWPQGVQPTTTNAEVIRVTNKGSGDDWTIQRTQEGSSARAIQVGDQIMAGLTSKSLTDIEEYLTGVTSPTLLAPVINTPPSNVARLTGEIVAYAGLTAPADWLLCYGAAVSRATYANLFAAIVPVLGTFTVTIANPNVVTLNGHGLVTGDAVYLTTTGALPTGLAADTLYYVLRVDDNTFNLCTTRANAHAGTRITTTGTQSGVHTARHCPYGLGDGSTTFNVPDFRGAVIAGADAMGGSAAGRLTNLALGGTYGQKGALGGEQAHQLTVAELAAHTHNLPTTALSLTGGGNNTPNNTDNADPDVVSKSTGGDAAHNTVQATGVANYIIKT